MRDTEAIHLKLVATVWLQQQWPRPRLIAADCGRQAALYRAGIATIRRIESQEGPMMGYVSTLWRLRRATTMETGPFEIQADHLKEFRQARRALPASRTVIYTLFGQVDPVSHNRNPASRDFTNATEAVAELNPIGPAIGPTVELTRCFLRLANLPNFALDRCLLIFSVLCGPSRAGHP
jgi:hypothetical protein